MSGRIVLLVFVLAACRNGNGREADDHAHEEEHGHGHGAVAFTTWGEHTELFAEYSPFVAGQSSDTAIHATQLSDFSAVTVGRLTVELEQSDGTVVSVTADAPARPGIFTPAIKPTVAGPCKLRFEVKTEAWTERAEAPACEVHMQAPPAPDDDDGGQISFLKEQQWNTEFATVLVGKQPVRKTIRVNAEIKPVTGRAAHLTATLAGRVLFSAQAPVIGMPVKKGQLLARVTPPLTGATNRASLEADLAAARAESAAARADHERVERLAKEEAVPTKRVHEASARTLVADSRSKAARERLREYDASASGRGGGGNAFRVRSPIAGTLVSVDVTSGETVEAGHHMFTVIDMEKVWVEGRVFEPDIPSVLAANTATFTVEGYERPFVIDDKTGRRIAVGQVIDPKNRTVPIVFEVQNSDRRLRIGQFAELEITTGKAVPLLAVPRGAVLTDGGRSVVFVQVDGEAFARRFVELGHKSEAWVVITQGLKAGERIVSVGAHTVKLAGAASSSPGHGHAH